MAIIDYERYWADTETEPNLLPIVAREAWHRDAWEREQDELGWLLADYGKTYPRQVDRKIFRNGN